MKIKSKYESVIRLEKIEVLECSFKKESSVSSNLELNVNIEPKVHILADNECEVILLTTLFDKNDQLYINVKLRGLFSVDSDVSQGMEKNMIAIMFPYMRSYISTITTQPEMTPIVLPVLNINAMMDDIDK